MPPPKKVKETDAIFARLKEVHQEAAAAPDALRLSLDAKATINLGPFARGGRSRTGTQAADHDFQPQGVLTPFGIYLPQQGELDLYFTATKVSSDFIVDRLEQWWLAHRAEHPQVRQLVLDLDNGPENSGQRSQFLYRLVCFAQKYQLRLRLAYYPPYHSKYNPIERCWGVLECYWRGELLDSEAAVLGYAAAMTYRGRHPRVQRVAQAYAKGVRRSKAQKRALERHLQRLPGLGKWFIDIPPPSPDLVFN
ncbi:MAG TPA: transposase [Gemmataceae bacterium]|nr:transposase [Gemmataceae bacterium]